MDFKFLKVLQSLLITYSYINHTKKKNKNIFIVISGTSKVNKFYVMNLI